MLIFRDVFFFGVVPWYFVESEHNSRKKKHLKFQLKVVKLLPAVFFGTDLCCCLPVNQWHGWRPWVLVTRYSLTIWWQSFTEFQIQTLGKKKGEVLSRTRGLFFFHWLNQEIPPLFPTTVLKFLCYDPYKPSKGFSQKTSWCFLMCDTMRVGITSPEVTKKTNLHAQNPRKYHNQRFGQKYIATGGGFEYFDYFHPENLGKIPILTNLFQMGWFNHQLDSDLPKVSSPPRSVPPEGFFPLEKR